MTNLDDFFQTLYNNFNDRNIDHVISQMTDDVKWANGMEGGHVHGHEGVRQYWTKQFTLVSARVTPLEITDENGVVKIKVHQVVHDLQGQLLADEMVWHFFTLKDHKIELFDIGEKVVSS